jgi:hypothetical protein
MNGTLALLAKQNQINSLGKNAAVDVVGDAAIALLDLVA